MAGFLIVILEWWGIVNSRKIWQVCSMSPSDETYPPKPHNGLELMQLSISNKTFLSVFFTHNSFFHHLIQWEVGGFNQDFYNSIVVASGCCAEAPFNQIRRTKVQTFYLFILIIFPRFNHNSNLLWCTNGLCTIATTNPFGSSIYTDESICR